MNLLIATTLLIAPVMADEPQYNHLLSGGSNAGVSIVDGNVSFGMSLNYTRLSTPAVGLGISATAAMSSGSSTVILGPHIRFTGPGDPRSVLAMVISPGMGLVRSQETVTPIALSRGINTNPFSRSRTDLVFIGQATVSKSVPIKDTNVSWTPFARLLYSPGDAPAVSVTPLAFSFVF